MSSEARAGASSGKKNFGAGAAPKQAGSETLVAEFPFLSLIRLHSLINLFIENQSQNWSHLRERGGRGSGSAKLVLC